MKFTLDQVKAKEADNQGAYVKTSGKYQGVIKAFEFVNFDSGSQAVEITFETDDKERASMRVITLKKDGTESEYGVKKIMALMTCIGIRESSVQTATRKKYDFSQGGEVDKQVEFAPEFENKEVGFLIEMEDYQNGNGEWKQKPSLFSSFQAKTGFTAKEILERATKPEQMEQLLNTLKNRSKKPHQPKTQQSTGYGNAPNGASQGCDDSDLPF